MTELEDLSDVVGIKRYTFQNVVLTFTKDLDSKEVYETSDIEESFEVS